MWYPPAFAASLRVVSPSPKETAPFVNSQAIGQGFVERGVTVRDPLQIVRDRLKFYRPFLDEIGFVGSKNNRFLN